MKWPLSKFNGSPEFSSWRKRIEIKQQQQQQKFNKRMKKKHFSHTKCMRPAAVNQTDTTIDTN